MSNASDRKAELAQEAERQGGTLVGELWAFLRHNKKWWLGPILVVLALAAVLVVLGGGSLAPLIYTVF
jgi:hypothetical protein